MSIKNLRGRDPQAIAGKHVIAYVDGSYSEGNYAYAVTLRPETNDQTEFQKPAIVEVNACRKFHELSNVSCELEACYRAIKLAQEYGASSITVYTDYEVIVHLINGEARPKNWEVARFVKELEAFKIPFKVEHVRGHAGNKYNREVDILARQAVRKLCRQTSKGGV